MTTAHGSPILLDNLHQPISAEVLTRVVLSPRSKGEQQHDEAWLQRLISMHPETLPIPQITQGYVGLRSICMELPVGRYAADLLLATASGQLCVVETKLWRNAGARREAVGQILEYAAIMSSWSYEKLNDAVRRALRVDGTGLGAPWGSVADPLYARANNLDLEQLIGSEGDQGQTQAQAQFVDAVSRSLQRAEMLLLIVGDGIHSETQGIVDLLRHHAGRAFTLGLVEMAVYSDRAGKAVVHPRVLALTERWLLPSPIPLDPSQMPSTQATGTVEEANFYDELGQLDAALAPRLQAFLEKCREAGIEPTLLKTFNLYVPGTDGRKWNLGGIERNGRVLLWGPAANDDRYGVRIGETYLRQVAASIPGLEFVAPGDDKSAWRIRIPNGPVYMPLSLFLDHEDAWIEVLRNAASEIRELAVVPSGTSSVVVLADEA